MSLSGCFASASAAAAAVRASSIWRGDIFGALRLYPAVTGGTIDVDHRGRVLVGCEGERTFPVEWILGGDRLVEGSRARGRVIAFLAPEPESVACLTSVRRPILPPQPGKRATPALTRIRLTWMRPRQGPKPWSLTIMTAGPSLLGQVAEQADRIIEPPDHLGGRAIPFGSFDAGLVDVEIRPDAVLERVEILKLNH